MSSPIMTPIRKSTVKHRLGGNQAKILLCPARVIATQPTLIEKPITDKDKVTAVGPYTFTDDTIKGFREVELQTNSVGFNFETVGPEDCQIFKQSFSGTLIGLDDDVLALAADSISEEFVGILLDPKGRRNILGSKELPFKITFKMAESKKLEDGLLVPIEVHAYNNVPVMRYDGPIPLHPSGAVAPLVVVPPVIQ